MRICSVLATILIISIAACDQSTPSFFEIADTVEGVDDDGYVYLDITVENISNGSGQNVQCVVTATEERSGSVLAEKTVLFARGDKIKAEEQATRQVVLYHVSALDALIEFEEIETEAGTERVALEPIVDLKFDLTWEDVGL